MRRRWKTALFAAFMLVLLVAGIEALAWAGGRIAYGPRFSRGHLQAQRTALAPGGGGFARAAWLDDEVLHPYLGFVPRDHLRGRLGVSADTRAAAAGDEVVVAIVGGSVARQFAGDGLPRLLDRLRELPRFRGKTLVPFNAAAGGYKQPQQLMLVAYLAALGERLDILINLDGFNDVTLYATEDASVRMFPAYPRRWHRRVQHALSRDEFRTMIRRLEAEDRRRQYAREFSRWPWRASNAASLVYLALDARLATQLAQADHALLAAEREAAPPLVATGPPVEFEDREELLAFLVDLWRRSSQAIHELSAGRGVRYYHFLQPNQYVPASKPMGPDEARTALANEAYRRTVGAAFPLLREAGRALAASGVRFHDLTAVFAGHREPLYVDNCCHFNPEGNLIVADRIFEAISRDLR